MEPESFLNWHHQNSKIMTNNTGHHIINEKLDGNDIILKATVKFPLFWPPDFWLQKFYEDSIRILKVMWLLEDWAQYCYILFLLSARFKCIHTCLPN